MKRLLPLLLLALAFHAQAQTTSTDKRALRLFQDARGYESDRDFDKAIALYERAVEADSAFAEAHVKLGLLYEVMRENNRSRSHFEAAVRHRPDDRSVMVAYFAMGKIWLSEGRYAQSKEQLERFVKYAAATRMTAMLQEGQQLLKNAEFALEGIKNPVSFQPVELPANINAFPHQFFPVLTADQQLLIFTMYDEKKGEDLYEAKWEDGAWGTPRPISELNSPYNEGTCSISADGRTMIFTSCEGADNRQLIGSCDLFITHKTGGKWSKPENLGTQVNTRYWESQPALSADGKRLFFASDRPGGKGRRDIWVSTLGPNGRWSAAVNAGDRINTPFDEYSPFIHVNGQNLFFSSNGHLGFGKLDLFRSDLGADGQWGAPQNLGYPINNGGDQASLFITTDGRRAYYSDGIVQDGRNVADRLFTFEIGMEESSPIKIEKAADVLTGVVYDARTKKTLGTSIDLVDLATKQVVYSVTSDSEDGRYSMVLAQGAEYALYVEQKGYLFKSLAFNYTEKSDPQTIVLDIYLDPIERGTTVALNNIFFASNSYELEGKSLTELEKLIRFLTENPEARIEIGAHTDSQGSDAYNLELSQNRARSVVEFLKEKGIGTARLEWKGYGETQPLADNETEEGRAANRRIEFKIL